MANATGAASQTRAIRAAAFAAGPSASTARVCRARRGGDRFARNRGRRDAYPSSAWRGFDQAVSMRGLVNTQP